MVIKKAEGTVSVSSEMKDTSPWSCTALLDSQGGKTSVLLPRDVSFLSSHRNQRATAPAQHLPRRCPRTSTDCTQPQDSPS